MGDRIFDPDFFKKLESIRINARMVMSEGGAGIRKSRAKGSSVEFSDFREYTPGDDFRRIDWNAYGRFDRLFVKLFMEEREAVVNIFIDGSKSMDFGEPKKSIMAQKIAAVLSYLALNNLDRVCINSMKDMTLSSSGMIMGSVMFDKCTSFLENITFSGCTNINECIKRKDFKARGISIIISDFFTPDGIEAALKYLLYKKQETVVIQILSQDEVNPVLEGQIRVVDSETGCFRDVSITPVFLKQYNKQLDKFLGGLKECSARVGASYIKVSSDETIEKVVLESLAGNGIIG